MELLVWQHVNRDYLHQVMNLLLRHWQQLTMVYLQSYIIRLLPWLPPIIKLFGHVMTLLLWLQITIVTYIMFL